MDDWDDPIATFPEWMCCAAVVVFAVMVAAAAFADELEAWFG